MSALDKVLALSRPGTEPQPGGQDEDTAEQVLALSTALDGMRLYLASSDPDDDGDDDSGGKGDTDDDEGSGHSDHATYEALCKKGVKPAMAAKMCAKADKKVAASALAESACVILAGLTEPDPAPEPTYVGRVVALAAPPGESASDRKSLAAKGWALDDGSYPMPDAKHVHSAAVLAASKHGDWKAAKSLIRKMAKIHGVELSSLPGFGGEKVSATMVALAAKAVDDGGVPMHHGPFNGTHAHSHHLTAAHAHPHQHFNDNHHDGGPQHRQGSKPGQGRFGGDY
jgi:hypothetical protein